MSEVRQSTHVSGLTVRTVMTVTSTASGPAAPNSQQTLCVMHNDRLDPPVQDRTARTRGSEGSWKALMNPTETEHEPNMDRLDALDVTECRDEGVPRWRRSGVRRATVIATALLLVVTGAVIWVVADVGGPDPANPQVAFTMGETTVSAKQVEDRVAVLEVLYGIEVPTETDELSAFRGATARTFAATLLISSEAEARGVATTTARAERTLDQYVTDRFGQAGRDDFDAALADAGIEEEDVLAEIRLQLDGQALFDVVTRDVTVAPGAVRAAFLSDPASWAVPARRRLRAIVVGDRSTATEVAASARSGTDFADLAARYSLDQATRDQGGDLGVLTPDQLDPAFGRAAFRAAQGQVFGPVATELGWYVGFVTRAYPALRDFAPLRPRITDSLVAARSLEVWNGAVAALLEDADVQYSPDYQPDPAEDSGLMPPRTGP